MRKLMTALFSKYLVLEIVSLCLWSLVVLSQLGCSALKARNVLNDLDGGGLVDRVGLFCSAGELLGINDASKCAEVVSTLQNNKDALTAIYDAAECVDKIDPQKPVLYQQCIDAVEGLADVIEEMK